MRSCCGCSAACFRQPTTSSVEQRWWKPSAAAAAVTAVNPQQRQDAQFGITTVRNIVKRHASHVTRHTSHVTRHTSHARITLDVANHHVLSRHDCLLQAAWPSPASRFCSDFTTGFSFESLKPIPNSHNPKSHNSKPTLMPHSDADALTRLQAEREGAGAAQQAHQA